MSLLFRMPELSDRNAVAAAAEASHAAENDAAFASIYLLREKYGTTVACTDEYVFRRYTNGIRAGAYGFPLGDGDLRKAVELLKTDSEAAGSLRFRLTMLTKQQCDLLHAAFPDCFTFQPMENYTEYLYRRENLAALRGSRYHRKRNHIAQFWRSSPEAFIQPLIAENVQYAVEIAKKWLANRTDSQEPSLLYELSCIEEAARNWDALGLSGLLLYAEEQPIGMTVISKISSGIYDVHFEKVIPNQPHAWPVVANEMAKCLPDAEFLNREEDLGDSGMRSSKQSYQPDLLQEKFTAEWNGKELSTC